MGGAIAALLAGIGVPTLLLDIVPRELTPDEEAAGLTLKDKQVRNRIVEQGWKATTKARPPAILSQFSQNSVTLGNLEDDFDKLAEVDWIVEVIVENLKIKQDLFGRIDKIRGEKTIISTNTSGLPLQDIAKDLSKGFKQHFIGTHFFNPPRWLKLLEIIPHAETSAEVMSFVTEFCKHRLGKGVVVCKDTPNFIGNRMFAVTSAFDVNYILEHKLDVEEIDAITGVLIGRPKTGTFRLRDLIGNDVAKHVGSNLYEMIPKDETRDVLANEGSVNLLSAMVDNKWFGNKTKVGFYKQVINDEGKKEFWVLDLDKMEHKPPLKPKLDIFGDGRDIENLGERYRWIVEQAENGTTDEKTKELASFLASSTDFALGYASRRVPEIADRFMDIDNAVKWGFAHEMGPFEIWDALGVKETIKRIEGGGYEVAPWVKEMIKKHDTFYQYKDGRAVGYYDLEAKKYTPLEVDELILPIETIKSQKDAILKRNASASLIDMGENIGLVEFHSKANALDQDIFDMMVHAMDEAEAGRFDALVIGNEGRHFSAGANVFVMWMAAQQGDFELIENMVQAMQQVLLRMRYFPKPIIAAPHGMVLGGGVEVIMACSKRIAAAESFIGLVETGTVGLIPAGTGTKEILRRVVNPVMRIKDADPVSVMAKVFEQLATAKVSAGAHEAYEMGFLQPGDRIIMNKDYLLAEAKRSALAMVTEGYQPPDPEPIYAAGRDILAALRASIWGMHESGWATDHDAVVAGELAQVLTGGDLSEPAWVPEQYILDLERQAFLNLCKETKSQERMGHLLEHNKPLRN
jgi:3-hydroxyacyl-CoA dehydrogenase